LVTVIIFLIDKTVDGNSGFFAGYFSDILVDIIAKKGRIVDERERARVEAGQTEKWKANILAMRT